MNLGFLVPHSCLRFTIAIAFLASSATEALKHNYYTKNDDRGLIGPLGFPFGFLDSGHYNLTVFDFQLMAPKKRHKHGDHVRSLAKDDNKCDSTKELCLADVLDNVKGVGFLLKQFRDEASFNRYMSYIKEDPSRCIFQKYLDLKKDEVFIDDLMGGSDDFDYNDFDDSFFSGNGDYDGGEYDDYGGGDDMFRSRQLKLRKLEEGPKGFGEVIDAVEDGIYLDMLPRSHWRPHSPSAAYDFQAGQAGFYFLMYQVCYKIDEGQSQNIEDSSLYDIHSRFELDFHFSNKDMFNHISYLSRGEMNLPWLYFVFSLMYATCLYVWHSNIKLIKEGKPGYFDIGVAAAPPPTIPGTTATSGGPTIYPIHYLMGFLLGLKFCSLLFQSIQYHYLRVIGHAVFFSAIHYTFEFLKGITLFTVILLIGSGWSFVKPFLTEREKRMILGVLILQGINNIAIVVLTQETEGEISFDRWTAILHLVDILCCCAVLIPIVWQVNQLEKNIEQSQHKGKDDNQTGIAGSEEDSFINDNNGGFLDEDVHIPENELDGLSNTDDESSGTAIPDARMAAKLRLFRSFYVLVIAYIYMTRIVVYLFAATLNYKHTWIPIFVVELTTILFYTAVGYMFRPMNENPYLHIPSRKATNSRVQVEMRKIDPSTKTALD